LPAKLIRLVIFRQPEFAAVAGSHNTLCRAMFVTGLIVLFDWRFSWLTQKCAHLAFLMARQRLGYEA
jgi:hypothetical protein